MPTRRKSSRADIPVEPSRNKPLLLLISIGVALAGLGLAYWSLVEIASLSASLRTGAPVVETMSAMYALPVLALAFLSIGMLLTLGLLPGKLAERAGAAVMAVLLGTVLLVGLFGPTGGFLNSVLMTRFGYERCEARSGIRVSWTVWAKGPESCGALPPAGGTIPQ